MTKKARHSKVGYGRPPKHARFRRGKSGNPKGRPKGSKNFKTLFLAEADQRVEIREGGRTRSVTKKEGVIKTIINKALQGDAPATRLVIEYLERYTEPQDPVDAVSLSDAEAGIVERFLDQEVDKRLKNKGRTTKSSVNKRRTSRSKRRDT